MLGTEIPGQPGHGDVLPAGEHVARPKSRGDIDGLRAVAVLPVLLFHAQVPFFSGGFVGVDVFFVISGYLITAILHREMAADSFSIITFYERRARRIIPALAVTMLAVLIVSWFMFLPKDLDDTGQSIVATATFASNFLFYLKTNYFGAAAETQPLLHTWSLAVEEQYYIFFPLFLLAVMKLARKRALEIVGATAALSLLLSAWSVFHYPVETFYFPVTRAWELLLGSLLAIALQKRLLLESSSELLTAIGLLLIVGSILFLSEQSPFPGLTAVPVCLGSALIIYGGTAAHSTAVARLLQWRFLTFTGLISYSLYLWHWPALVFANYYLLRPAEGFELVALLVGVYLLSILSWRYVETPVRKGRILSQRGPLFAAAFAALALLGAAGAALMLSNGSPGRLDKDVVALDQQRFAERHSDCPAAPGAAQSAMCRIGSGPVDFVVWGDSHAAALRPAFAAAATKTGANGLLVTANGCAPLAGLNRKAVVRQQNDCRRYNRETLGLIRGTGAGVVFLTANWLAYAEPGQYRNGTLASGLEATLEALRGLDVYIISRTPGGRTDVATGLARARMFDRPQALVELKPSDVELEQRSLNRLFASLERRPGVGIVWTYRHLCSATRCPVEVSGAPLYSDAHHLTEAGARYLVPVLEPLLTQAAAKSPRTPRPSVRR